MFSATKSFFTNEATGGLAPSWSLDFSSGSFSGATLTRASSGTYVDSSGYIASASTDIARLTHNSSGSRLGLLVEGQRTNYVAQSEDFGTTWQKLNASVSTNTVTAPDNTTTADSLHDNATTGAHVVYQSSGTMGSLTGNQIYTASVYLKKGDRQYVGMQLNDGADGYKIMVDLDAGTITDGANVGSPTNTSSRITSVGNGWYRVEVSAQMATSGTINGEFYITLSDRSTYTGTLQFGQPSYAGNASLVAVYAWGAQFEAGSTATSYIKTTTNSVTREADLAHVLDSSITNWGDPGALVVHFYPPGQAGTLISTDNASTAQIGIEAQTSATTIRGMWSSGQTATSTTSGTGVQKAVHYWNGTNSRFCLNGGTVQTGTNNLTIGNTDFVTLGAESTESGGTPNQNPYTDYANCIIRKVEFYSGTLTDGNLQTITT